MPDRDHPPLFAPAPWNPSRLIPVWIEGDHLEWLGGEVGRLTPIVMPVGPCRLWHRLENMGYRTLVWERKPL